MLQNFKIANKPNWLKSIKELLEMLGFGFVWMNGGVENDKYFIRQLIRDSEIDSYRFGTA